jgi:hypothetical protein
MGGLAHAGIVHSALWIEEHYLCKIKAWIKQYDAKGLYLVGHSLGGAIASCVLMLSQETLMETMGETFEIKAFTFATPPCVSRDLNEHYSPFIETYINEYDIVPKASYGAFMDFKEILKLAVQLSNDLNLSKKEKMERIHDLSVQLKITNKHPRLFIPGAVYLIYKTSRLDPKNSVKVVEHQTGNPIIDHHEPHYVVERSLHEYFDDMHIKSGMLVHHFLNKYDNGLRKAHDWLVSYQKEK